MESVKANTHKSHALILHPLAWAAIIAIPLFVTRPEIPIVTSEQYLHFLLSAISLMLVFYINYFIFIDRFLFKQNIGKYLIFNAILIIITMMITRLISLNLLPPPRFMNDIPPHPHGKPHVPIIAREAGNFFINVLVVAASVAIKSTGEWFKAENAIKETEKNRTEAELQNLKSQLNPHFLFNTLNNIYSLVQFDTDKAQEAIMDLSKALRYVLYESSSDTVRLKSDIAFVNEYISLMRMRLTSSTILSVKLPDSDSDIMNKQIAPLLFISIIENAFKHGIGGDKESLIDIDIHGEGGNGDSSIVCHVTNSNNPKNDTDRSGSGVGLNNLSKRLELLYPGKHSFTHGVKGETYESTLIIKLD